MLEVENFTDEEFEEFLNPKFIGWDGEGFSNPGGPQPYCLFGASTLDYLVRKQLKTKDMLQLILRVGAENPGAIHVAYAFVYDVNQILWEFTGHQWKNLFEKQTLRKGHVSRKGQVKWKGYRIKWIPGKIFEVAGREEVSQRWIKVTIYDLFSYFGCRFTDALRSWVKDYTGNEIIEKGKARRNSFQWAQIDEIEEYWLEEIEQVVTLANALRDNLATGAQIRLKKWYGPGTIADALFEKHGIRDHMDKQPHTMVRRAAQHAYFAGRFELWAAGLYEGKVWQNDINSAYPSAMVHLPSLANGYWKHTENVREVKGFGIYHIRRTSDRYTSVRNAVAQSSRLMGPQPLPYRNRQGNVRFPEWVNGWYWSPEARLVWDDSTYEFLEAWEFVEDEPGLRPFAWVGDMYEKRLKFKAEHNPAELSVKLGLNSLYGKMAQRIGWNEETGEAPKWHQLEWAGFITSYTRAELYPLLVEAWERDALISCETDSVMASVELGVDWHGTRLGGWDNKTYEGVAYLQNGLYFKDEGGRWSHKIRGMDKPPGEGEEIEEGQNPITFDRVLEWLMTPRFYRKSNQLRVTTTRFIGIHKALHTRKPWDHRVWKTEFKRITFGGAGKRLHIPNRCRECVKGNHDGVRLHDLTLDPKIIREISRPHQLPWIEGGVDEYEWVDEKIRDGSFGGEMTMEG